MPMQAGWALGIKAWLAASPPAACMPPLSGRKGSCRPSGAPASDASGCGSDWDAAAATGEERGRLGPLQRRGPSTRAHDSVRACNIHAGNCNSIPTTGVLLPRACAYLRHQKGQAPGRCAGVSTPGQPPPQPRSANPGAAAANPPAVAAGPCLLPKRPWAAAVPRLSWPWLVTQPRGAGVGQQPH